LTQKLNLKEKNQRKSAIDAVLVSVEQQSSNLHARNESLTTGRGKAPWGTAERSSPFSKSQAPAFRQIQQSEMKKEEDRKAVERKQRANSRPVNTAQGSEELVVGAWGLPTSQTGSRTNKDKETTALSISTSSGPVWTNVVRPSSEKKSMKEILEEEKRQQASARDKEITAAHAKRAYAESATKNAASNEPSSSGWTTVGSNGKAANTNNNNRATNQQTTSPSLGPSQPSPSAQRSQANEATAIRTSSTTMGNKASTPRAVAVEERRHDPSLDFLRWLRESLKGLNPGVNVDEFIQMLLSFPVEASQDTIDLIQEQAYANSTTIDGRRFAADFIARRKLDMQPQSRGSAGTGTTSLADVVKAPQKSTQSDWGYKVVKKKGKGGKGR